jgi:hydroxymethylbilane synthase
MHDIKVGTRKSLLAMRQTELVVECVKSRFPEICFEVVPMSTKGDEILNVRLDKIGGKGLFIKELEDALYKGTIDMAVHSGKDMPNTLPPGLSIICASRREDPRDVLVSVNGYTVETLPEGAVVGTSSLRREVLMGEARPDVEFKQLRGNIQTRINKMKSGEYDAIILAAAGLIRMGIADVDMYYLDTDRFIPSAGQGIMVIEARDSDDLSEVVESAGDKDAWDCLAAERAYMKALNGSCSTPIAAFARINDGHMTISGMYCPEKVAIRDSVSGNAADAAKLGTELAERIIRKKESGLYE